MPGAAAGREGIWDSICEAVEWLAVSPLSLKESRSSDISILARHQERVDADGAASRIAGSGIDDNDVA